MEMDYLTDQNIGRKMDCRWCECGLDWKDSG